MAAVSCRSVYHPLLTSERTVRGGGSDILSNVAMKPTELVTKETGINSEIELSETEKEHDKIPGGSNN